MSELKPCPFCGGEAEMNQTVKKVYVRCKMCGARTAQESGGNYAERGSLAAWLWNKRTTATHRNTLPEPPEVDE